MHVLVEIDSTAPGRAGGPKEREEKRKEERRDRSKRNEGVDPVCTYAI